MDSPLRSECGKLLPLSRGATSRAGSKALTSQRTPKAETLHEKLRQIFIRMTALEMDDLTRNTYLKLP
jgi:hypothetical protein